MPAFVNSVISVGSSEPAGFVVALVPAAAGRPAKPWPNPARLVDSARSADAAMKSGRPWSRRAARSPSLPTPRGRPGWGGLARLRTSRPGRRGSKRRASSKTPRGPPPRRKPGISPARCRRSRAAGPRASARGRSRRITDRATSRLGACAVLLGGVRRRRLVHALVGHAVAGHELAADRPELRRMPRPPSRGSRRRSCRSRGPSGCGTRPPTGHRRVVARAASSTARVTGPRPSLRPCRTPASRTARTSRPACRGRPRRRPAIDPEVVPVHEEDEVGEAQAPGRVLRLVGGAGREPALALDHEHPDLARTGHASAPAPARRRAACRGRTARCWP